MHTRLLILITILLSVLGFGPDAKADVRDHLGSTRAVIDEAGELLQTVNYYASGVPFTLTQGETATDRLHSGKQFIDHQGLGYYDNSARMLDILGGRFTTLDPMATDYGHLSPYTYCAANPLKYTDPTGMFVIFLPGTTESYINDFNSAIKYLQSHGAGDNVNHILTSEEMYFVGYGDKNAFDYSKNIIYWMNDKAIITSSVYILNAAETLNHESAHAKHMSEDKDGTLNKQKKIDSNYGNQEERAVILGEESETAKKLGKILPNELTRKDHSGTIYPVESPTSDEVNGYIVTP